MENQEYLRIYNGYAEWLTRINYAKSTRKLKLRNLKIFFDWLEIQAIESLEEIEQADLELFTEFLLNCRSSQGKALAKTTVRARFNVIMQLNKYLEAFDGTPISVKPMVQFADTRIAPDVLSKAEIQALYDACGNDEQGLRDRVLLSLYYGCGLRAGEGRNLTLNDVDVKSGWVHIRKGKHYLERYVPLTENGKSDIRDYLKYGRWYYEKQYSEYLLLSNQGTQLSGTALLKSLKRLARVAEIDKRVFTHLLRHSIATHLLENGMDLEQIQLFLGHRHLLSTQLYTHITEAQV